MFTRYARQRTDNELAVARQIRYQNQMQEKYKQAHQTLEHHKW